MTNRRTSIYSLRTVTPEPALAAANLRRAAEAAGVLVQDNHTGILNGERYAALGFRAPDDESAARTAFEILDWAQAHHCPTTLLTGYGVHRRTVEL